MKYSPEQDRCQQVVRRKKSAASRKSRRGAHSKRQSTPVTQISDCSAYNNKVANTPNKAVNRLNCMPKVFQVLRILIDVMRYTPDSYNSCLQLLQKYLAYCHRLLIRGKLLALTIFLIYSKVYEFRPLSVRCFQDAMIGKVSTEDIISAQAHVLQVLSFDIHVSHTLPQCNAQLEDAISRMPLCQHMAF